MSESWADAERAAVRRTRGRVSLLVGLAITVLVVFTGGIAYAVMVQGQRAQVHRELRYSTEHGEPTAPPVGTWLFTLTDGVVTGGSAPAPDGFPIRGDLDVARDAGSVVERTVERNGMVYLVRTEPRGADAVQAVFDMRYQLADRRHLLLALAVAEIVGLLAAAATGTVVGRRTVAPLAEALARQRRFVTDASHELRTPLAQAYTRVQLLARRAAAAELPGDHRAGLELLAGAIRRLGDIVDDQLLSARLAVEPAGLDQRPVDLSALAESVVAAESDRATQRRLTLTVARPPDPLLVNGVDSALRRVVGELLANAVNHTPPGGRIDLTLRRVAGRQMELTIVDTGAGFDPADADRIFDRFHRGAGGAERQYGLGLALLREVVTSHRGTIEAVGHLGRGARFTLRLPALIDGTSMR